jgi:hypothetical protein
LTKEAGRCADGLRARDGTGRARCGAVHSIQLVGVRITEAGRRAHRRPIEWKFCNDGLPSLFHRSAITAGRILRGKFRDLFGGVDAVLIAGLQTVTPARVMKSRCLNCSNCIRSPHPGPDCRISNWRDQSGTERFCNRPSRRRCHAPPRRSGPKRQQPPSVSCSASLPSA